MTAYSKVKLSGSTNGKPIKIVATSTPGTTIHTAVAGSSDWDEIWLYAFNSSDDVATLTLEWGGTSAPDQNIVVALPPKSGLIPVVPGLLLQNSLAVAAFASVANVITINGFVNRIT